MSTNHTCKYFGKCGGCQTPNLTYPEQLSMKMAKVIGLMGRLCHVDEIVPMEDPYHYRCKVQTAFTRVGGEMMAGIYQSASGRVIPAKSCMGGPANSRNTSIPACRPTACSCACSRTNAAWNMIWAAGCWPSSACMFSIEGDAYA